MDFEPFWIAKDICDVLGIVEHHRAIARHNENQKGVHAVDTLGGKQQMSTVNEAGLYKLIFTSRKKEAEHFSNWVAEEVLPSIRKTGKYEITPSTPQPPVPHASKDVNVV